MSNSHREHFIMAYKSLESIRCTHASNESYNWILLNEKTEYKHEVVFKTFNYKGDTAKWPDYTITCN